MMQVIEGMLEQYENGRIDRRRLIQGLAFLAGTAQATPAAESTFRGVEINHVALRVTDVQRSRDFYRKHFGMPVVSESSSSCFLGLRENFLALFRGSNPGMDHYCIGIDNYSVGPVTETLKRLGLNPNQPSGSNRVYFKDPDGLTVQVSAAGHQP